ncbi:tol-pal system protein YbgF [Camelimonas lactis]|uniref:Cell division coordinator CpoB n=1 Tax=Camelimonas lactis TaxID=659006 RepID=A0A4R2GR59_9HYPH|nr:tol-pal system protein YbgF [Camelimonas lactis]TCO12461.1 tol-pal system protein YbgF [Camelimonas lactis]
MTLQLPKLAAFSRVTALFGGLALAAGLAVLPAPAARAQDAADIVVRMGQLEEQVRTMSGRIEQLQFENRRLNEQLRKFQQDVEFRLQEKSGGGGASPAPSTSPGRERRGDAGAGVSPGGSSQVAGQTGAAGAGGDAFENARGQFQQRQYAAAEMGFRQFLQANPRDRRAPEAIYWLGESYFQRQQYSEAAEQFLKISTEYAKSARGPDALVKLGMSLSRLNAKQEACATLAEVLRKYPNASVDVRSAVERERRRTKC